MPFMTNSSIMTMLAFRPKESDPIFSTPTTRDREPDEHKTETADIAPSDLVQPIQQPSLTSNDIDGKLDRATRLKAKNRRKRFLELHPEYYQNSSLELADPILYDRLIRHFQSSAEREAEGRRKGFTGQMSADVLRIEAKKYAVSHPKTRSLFAYSRGPYGEIREDDDISFSKEEGKAWWMDEMTQRFLRGDDAEFDYDTVDLREKYNDPEEERDRQDAWFDSMDSDFDSDGEGKEKILVGETGIQDY